MPGFTPKFIRDKYEIYKNKGDTDFARLTNIKSRISKINFDIDLGRGDSIKWLEKNKG